MLGDLHAAVDAPSPLDAILRELAPSAEPFTVELGSSTLAFKPIVGYAEVKESLRLAKQYAEKAAAGAFPYPTYGADAETLRSASLMAQASLEPRLSERDLLEIAGKAGYVFLALKFQFDQKSILPQAQAEAEAIEALKND